MLVSPDSHVDRLAGEPSQFRLRLRDGGLDAAWVWVVGELDIATAPWLDQTLRSAELSARWLVLDLRELTFMDCCGVHAIVNAGIRARTTGHRLVVVRGGSAVDRVFGLTGAATALEIVNLDAAEPPVQALVQIARRDHAAERADRAIRADEVIRVLENILTESEGVLVAEGERGAVIAGRVAVQTDTQDEFTAAIERSTQVRSVA